MFDGLSNVISHLLQETSMILETSSTESVTAHDLRRRIIEVLIAAGESAPLTMEDLQALVRSTKESKP